jgi:hypothetical protein
MHLLHKKKARCGPNLFVSLGEDISPASLNDLAKRKSNIFYNSLSSWECKTARYMKDISSHNKMIMIFMKLISLEYCKYYHFVKIYHLQVRMTLQNESSNIFSSYEYIN